MLAQSMDSLSEASRWTPGIGDPTVIGWLTVVGYLVAAWSCRRASDEVPTRALESTRWLRRYWILIALALCLLGINKQLDLQSLLTQVGRDLAKTGGWYGDRREVQALFVWCVAALSLMTIGLILVCGWAVRHYILPSSLGMGVLLTFVVIRAASFHHVDVLIGHRVIGVTVNVILELGGIVIVAWGARRYVGLAKTEETEHALE